jgi:TolB protein
MKARECAPATGWRPGLAVLLAVSVASAMAVVWSAEPTHPSDRGLFEADGDVGATQHPGAVAFDRESGDYRVTASGENIWATVDAFHFVWRPVAEDLDLAARVRFEGLGQHAHRKAGLMMRASLAPDAPYADVVVHGDGLIALQYRELQGGETREIRSTLVGVPAALRLRRQGEVFTFFVARPGEPLQEAGSVRLAMGGSLYAGLVVCSHEADVLETAVFSEVTMDSGSRAEVEPREPKVESRLEIVSVDTGARRVVMTARGRFEAPNWSRDGGFLIFNREGRIYRMPVSGGEPALVDTGFATSCNNDHGLSPDGTLLAVSHHGPDGKSLIHVLPATGGTPRLVTPLGPSYWHGWSPDGRTLAYCAEREGEFDIYTIAVAGGPETRLTSAPGLDDGPDYTADGRFIYFNSERTGRMQIWRMRGDGSDQGQVTSDGFADWFPHPSPDGRWLVFLSYEPDVKGHPPDKDVTLRIMPLSGGAPRVLVRLFGGQGTINVPSWSPDSREVAFVSYRKLD